MNRHEMQIRFIPTQHAQTLGVHKYSGDIGISSILSSVLHMLHHKLCDFQQILWLKFQLNMLSKRSACKRSIAKQSHQIKQKQWNEHFCISGIAQLSPAFPFIWYINLPRNYEDQVNWYGLNDASFVDKKCFNSSMEFFHTSTFRTHFFDN